MERRGGKACCCSEVRLGGRKGGEGTEWRGGERKGGEGRPVAAVR